MEEKSISQKLDEINEKLEENGEKKKGFKLPRVARVSKKKMQKGYATIQIIHENKAVEFKKEPIKDSTIRLQDGNDITFHAVDSNDVLNYKGKPFLIMPKTKKNPYNPIDGTNETYGHKYILARMESEKLTLKKKMGWGLSIGILIIAGIIAYSVLTGG